MSFSTMSVSTRPCRRFAFAFFVALVVSVGAAAPASAQTPVIAPTSGFEYCVLAGCSYSYTGTVGTPITVELRYNGSPMTGAFAWSVSGGGASPSSGTGSTFTFTPNYSGAAIVSVTNYSPAPAPVGFQISGGSPPPSSLGVSVTASNTFPAAGTPVTLHAFPSGGTGSYPTYDWNFGDTNLTSGNYPNLSHTWVSAGSYEVTCTVHDSSGATASGSATINVQAMNGPVVTTLAGTGQRGSADGPGPSASFAVPMSVAVDAAGNVYVADSGGHTIRKITPSGVVSTLAGQPGSFGNADGTGSAAQFYAPVGVAVDGAGNVYVGDQNNNKIRKITPAGVVTTLAGTGAQGSADGPAAGATFGFPQGVAVDAAGNVYIADGANNKIRKIVFSPGILNVPASGSIHGVGGAFFHTDLWIKNQSFSTPATVTATYYCYTSSGCWGRVGTITLAPRESRLIPDIDASLFSAPESAGPFQLSSSGGAIVAYTRSYTPAEPAPTNGTSIPALTAADAKTRALFLGLGSNGGNTSQGFRSNAGIFNPNSSDVTVTLTLSDGSGARIGATVSQTVAALSAVQLNIFKIAGAEQTVTTNASLLVTASAPVFPYVTVIDNQSGDSVFAPAFNDEIPPP